MGHTLLYEAKSYILTFFKMGQPRPLFRLFSVFSNKHYKFLQQIYVKKCPSSIWCRDSNPQPSQREYPPITTRHSKSYIVTFLYSTLTCLNSEAC